MTESTGAFAHVPKDGFQGYQGPKPGDKKPFPWIQDDTWELWLGVATDLTVNNPHHPEHRHGANQFKEMPMLDSMRLAGAIAADYAKHGVPYYEKLHADARRAKDEAKQLQAEEKFNSDVAKTVEFYETMDKTIASLDAKSAVGKSRKEFLDKVAQTLGGVPDKYAADEEPETDYERSAKASAARIDQAVDQLNAKAGAKKTNESGVQDAADENSAGPSITETPSAPAGPGRLQTLWSPGEGAFGRGAPIKPREPAPYHHPGVNQAIVEHQQKAEREAHDAELAAHHIVRRNVKGVQLIYFDAQSARLQPTHPFMGSIVHEVVSRAKREEAEEAAARRQLLAEIAAIEGREEDGLR